MAAMARIALVPNQAKLGSTTARNSKSEARNPKQIQNPKFQTCALKNEYLPDHQRFGFWILTFVFVSDFDFRASDFLSIYRRLA